MGTAKAALSLSRPDVLPRYAEWLETAGLESVMVRSPEELNGHALLVLCGGGDIGAGRWAYEDEDHASGHLQDVNEERDTLEWALLDAARERGMAVFGICRGLQVINVYMGGTLMADLAAEGHDADHHREPGHGGNNFESADVWHDVINPVGTGSRFPVVSNHHQAIERLAPGLVATAQADDGVVEGVLAADYPWVAVQWHPERMGRSYGRTEPARWLHDLVARA